MAALLKNVFNAFTNVLKPALGCVPSISAAKSFSPLLMPCRTKYIDGWIDWRMLRDVKRRKCIKQHAKLRLQINALRRNTILPLKLREVAQKEIEALPTDSCLTKVHARCILTSRARGRWKKYRMSRIAWRNLADYNKLSGVERAMWSFS